MTMTGAVHMPVGDLPRRMTVVRLYDGRLVIFSAMSLNDEQMGVLEAFGRPAFLIVPGDHHRRWHARTRSSIARERPRWHDAGAQ